MQLNRRPDGLTRWLALMGSAAPLVLIVSGTVAALLTPGYSPTNDTISQLSSPGTPYPQILSSAFLAYGVLILPLAWALHRVLGDGALGNGVTVLLLCYATGYILAGLFRTDSNHLLALGLSENTIHENAVRMAFSAIILTMAGMSVAVWREPDWRGFAVFSLSVLILTSVLGLAFVTLRLPSVAGVSELGALLAVLLWVEVLGLSLYGQMRAPRRPRSMKEATGTARRNGRTDAKWPFIASRAAGGAPSGSSGSARRSGRRRAGSSRR